MNLLKHLAFFILLPMSSLMAQPGYTIQLDLTGFKDGTAFELVDLDLGKAIDSTRLKGGKLVFQGVVKEPVAGRIHTIDRKYLVVYLENKAITIKGNYDDFYYAQIKGSEINDYWVRSRNGLKSYQQGRDSLVQKYLSLRDADSLQARQVSRKMNEMDRWEVNYRKKFIQTEKPSYFTLHELFFLRNDFTSDTLQAMFSRFPADLQKSKDGLVINSYIENSMPQLGQHFTDIEGVDPNGKSHKLSEFKGQYVLLDFWASWCGPCRQENPLTLKAYNQYRDKGFEIFGFSIDSDESSWVKAVKKDGLTWVNVSDLKGAHSMGAARYKIRAIPQNFLIDPTGTIIARNLRGDELVEKLKSIYKD